MPRAVLLRSGHRLKDVAPVAAKPSHRSGIDLAAEPQRNVSGREHVPRAPALVCPLVVDLPSIEVSAITPPASSVDTLATQAGAPSRG
jgi:hypothetical protein